MNMRGLFYPNIRMGQAIRETAHVGQSRIEITYTATTKAAENMLLSPLFKNEAEVDLNKAELALRKVDDLCWHIPLESLLDGFVQAARNYQLLIVQPALTAIVYASNSKRGCFTGFYQKTPAR